MKIGKYVKDYTSGKRVGFIRVLSEVKELAEAIAKFNKKDIKEEWQDILHFVQLWLYWRFGLNQDVWRYTGESVKKFMERKAVWGKIYKYAGLTENVSNYVGNYKKEEKVIKQLKNFGIDEITAKQIWETALVNNFWTTTGKIMTLCLIMEADKILLGMKKRGFGAGRWNGFGGKVHEGETIEEALHRELQEEAGVTVKTIEKRGVIDFDNNGKMLTVHIFKGTEIVGSPSESEEMLPKWFDINELPFETMWPDDKYWLPLFLADKKFTGKFIFDADDNVLSYELNEVDSF
ncbi:MAG: 8-oxo-dGTP diphosphatase [Patescibacteria group bacterium]|jgi:8-oxo-dGTP diphosphatase/2-hydroxy-dATP diphosphatase